MLKKIKNKIESSTKYQLFINLFCQIFLVVTNMAISFFLVPFILKKLGADAYGFVGLANDFISYAQIVTIALNSMASRFITINLCQKKYDTANKMFNSVLIGNIIIGLALAIPMMLVIIFLPNIVTVPSAILHSVRILWIILFINFIITIITSVFGVSTYATNKLYLSYLRQIEGQAVRSIILIITFVFLPTRLWYVGLATLFATLIVSLYNYKYVKKFLPEIEFNKKYFDKKSIFTLIGSGIWNTVTKLGGLLSSGLDLLLTNTFINSTLMGILSVSKTLPNVILSFFGNLTSVFSPQLTISYAKGDYEGIKEQLIFSMKLVGIFACIPISIMIGLGMDFYNLWIPTADSNLLWWLSVVSGIGMVLSMPLEPLWNIFSTTNKVKQSSIFLIASSFANIIIVLILLNIFDSDYVRLFVIAGTSTIISLVKSLTFLPMYGAKCVNLKWNTFYPTILKNTFSTIIVTTLAFFIKKLLSINSWIMFIMNSIIVVIIALVINVFIVLNKEDRKKILSLIKEKLNKIKGNKVKE